MLGFVEALTHWAVRLVLVVSVQCLPHAHAAAAMLTTLEHQCTCMCYSHVYIGHVNSYVC